VRILNNYKMKQSYLTRTSDIMVTLYKGSLLDCQNSNAIWNGSVKQQNHFMDVLSIVTNIMTAGH
jgi:hypothetical protein